MGINEFRVKTWSVVHRYLPEPLKNELRREGSDVLTVEMLNSVAQTLAENDFVVFLEPPSIDERIVNQHALFSLMSDPEARLIEWLEGHPETCHRTILPTQLKWEVRDKLDQANITERVLFPGLDGLSAWLKRQNSPRK